MGFNLAFKGLTAKNMRKCVDYYGGAAESDEDLTRRSSQRKRTYQPQSGNVLVQRHRVHCPDEVE